MKIQLHLDTSRLTLDDLVFVDDLTSRAGEMGLKIARPLREFLSRFVVGENGEYLPEDEALKIVGKMSIDEVLEASKRFGESIKGLQAATVPPESNGA